MPFLLLVAYSFSVPEDAGDLDPLKMAAAVEMLLGRYGLEGAT